MSDTINDPELKAMSRILSVVGRDADGTPETPIGESLRRLAMFRIDMIRQNTKHRDKRRRHQGRASCDVAGRRFEAQGPAPIYKLATLLWLHGHGGEEFEAHDDVSPTGKPGGLAMRGKVRNWARMVKGKPVFDKDAPPEVDFSSHDRSLVAQAAGRAVDLTENGLCTARERSYRALASFGRPRPSPRAGRSLYGRCRSPHPGGGMNRITARSPEIDFRFTPYSRHSRGRH